MIRNRFLFAIILSILLNNIACKNEFYKKNKNGLRYHFFTENNGAKPKLGDILQLHMIYKNAKDSVLYDSKILGDSFLLELKSPSFVGGLEEGLVMMSEGDSASFLLNADSIYQKIFNLKRPSFIKPDEDLRFDIKLNKIMSRSAMNEMLKSKKELIEDKEIETIKVYLKENSLRAEEIKKGVYYINFVDGKGTNPIAGKDVEVSYIVKSLSGRVFDSSDQTGHSLKFKIGEGTYLKEWVEAIMMMKEGGQSRLILTSTNGYGSEGFGPITGNTPLVFDIHLIKVYN